MILRSYSLIIGSFIDLVTIWFPGHALAKWKCTKASRIISLNGKKGKIWLLKKDKFQTLLKYKEFYVKNTKAHLIGECTKRIW